MCTLKCRLCDTRFNLTNVLCFPCSSQLSRNCKVRTFWPCERLCGGTKNSQMLRQFEASTKCDGSTEEKVAVGKEALVMVKPVAPLDDYWWRFMGTKAEWDGYKTQKKENCEMTLAFSSDIILILFLHFLFLSVFTNSSFGVQCRSSPKDHWSCFVNDISFMGRWEFFH